MTLEGTCRSAPTFLERADIIFMDVVVLLLSLSFVRNKLHKSGVCGGLFLNLKWLSLPGPGLQLHGCWHFCIQ